MGGRKSVGEEGEAELGMASAAPLRGCVWGVTPEGASVRHTENSPRLISVTGPWSNSFRGKHVGEAGSCGSQGPSSQGWIPAVNIPAVSRTSLGTIPRQNVLCPPVPVCFQQSSSWHLLQALESSWQFLFIRDPDSCSHQFYLRVTQLTGEHRRRGPGFLFLILQEQLN